MKTPRQKIKNKLDKLFTQMVMFRDSRTCQWCNKTQGQMQTSHVVGRTNLHLRWNLNNACCLCAYCHLRKWHAHPLEGVEWFIGKYPDRYNYLQVENKKQVKYSTKDLEEVYAGLKQVAIQVGAI
jgi:5-methylcytosine-specific restriction endonuclease McrA